MPWMARVASCVLAPCRRAPDQPTSIAHRPHSIGKGAWTLIRAGGESDRHLGTNEPAKHTYTSRSGSMIRWQNNPETRPDSKMDPSSDCVTVGISWPVAPIIFGADYRRSRAHKTASGPERKHPIPQLVPYGAPAAAKSTTQHMSVTL